MTKFLFAGEGGQGVQVIAEILAEAAFSEGKSALYIPNFGVEQRGGISLAFVVIDEKAVVYPKFATADFLVLLSERSKERTSQYIGDSTKVIAGPAVEGGLKSDLPPQVWNIVLLGEVSRLSQIVKKESLVGSLNLRFAKQFQKNPQLQELDLKALG